ncbi:MAG: aspartate aminotransferase family protein, partial [Gammaproteobacteria bacterium]
MAASHSIFGRTPRASLPTAVAGDGIYLIDSDGKRYLDACGGAAVSCLGHTPQRVIDRACEQLQKLA